MTAITETMTEMATETTTDTATESTTESETESPTESPTEPPELGFEALEFQFRSLTGGFSMDATIAAIAGDFDHSYLSMIIDSDPESDFATSVAGDNVVLVAVAGTECPEGIELTTTVDGDVIADVRTTGRFAQIETTSFRQPSI